MGTMRRYGGYGVLLLAIPVIAMTVPEIAGHDLPELPYYLMLLAVLLACATAVGCMRSPAYERRTMLCLAIGLGCWAAGMANAIANSGTDDNAIINYVFFVAYGLPLLYAVSANRDEPTTPGRRIVDGILFLLLVVLCYLGVEDLQDGRGLLRHEYVGWVAAAFDVENVFLFLVFFVRAMAAESDAEFRFFRVTAVFLGVYAAAAAIHNHDVLYPQALWLQRAADTLPAIAFVLLACLLHANRTPRPFKPPYRRWARWAAAGFAPGVLLAAVFAMSVGIRESHGLVGRVALALAMLTYIVRVVQTQFWFATARDRLKEALSAVERLSLLDELTGVPNRRAFEHTLAALTGEAQRDGRPLSALMIDVDLFKTFNDTLGHPEGDVALVAVARLLAGTLRRPADFIARYGGEEFVVLLPNTPIQGAEVVARRMTRAVYDAALDFPHGIDGRVTVSIGIAFGNAPDGAALLRQADMALYQAKHAGRNGHVALDGAVDLSDLGFA
ncbi:GGDEF domain-containing protein [Luteibacter aegosomatissinici]|uniref:GGDEF domain-containing protein n=1 Tax=Luteibacter aegosomatissinici TaxID=2911539 RepID=UPI001FF751E8|nr:GGDEF domain-containing protein [Luteibacter aegosomatissinici]UPG92638.1 diguanylate cyclase [Luteibacter aegosomatissinici]